MSKGFTLIELLIVIGILAILATVTVVVLNPGQLFAQARDSQRMSDLETVSKAIGYYLLNTSSVDLDSALSVCGTSGTQSLAYTGTIAGATTSLICAGTCSQVAVSAANVTNVDGTGWIPVNFASGMLAGTSISDLPIDPTNTTGATGYAYSYGCNNAAATYEIDANLESQKYSYTGSDDKESKDGGNSATLYEVGNDPGLNM